MSRLRLSSEEEKFAEALFIEWTHGLTPVEQRISIFSHIRDIPYAIMPEWEDEGRLIIMMIHENRGWCGPKHILLTWMFKRLNIATELVLIPFKWQDQPVQYPDLLREMASVLPITNHLCCKALLNGVWQLLDATWDLPLVRADFPVNELWDGVSGTIPAVTPIKPEDKKQTYSTSTTVRMKRVDFVRHLNRWMEEMRITP